MNQITWQGKLRQLRGEVKRELGKFTQNDRQRIEGEFDRIIGQMQQRYGYTSQRAWHELTRQWHDYGRPLRAALKLDGRRQRQTLPQRIGQQIPWVALAFGLIGFILVVAQLRNARPSTQQSARPVTATGGRREKRQEAMRQETVQDAVDEQSWQSFPASDPPASW